MIRTGRKWVDNNNYILYFRLIIKYSDGTLYETVIVKCHGVTNIVAVVVCPFQPSSSLIRVLRVLKAQFSYRLDGSVP